MQRWLHSERGVLSTVQPHADGMLVHVSAVQLQRLHHSAPVPPVRIAEPPLVADSAQSACAPLPGGPPKAHALVQRALLRIESLRVGGHWQRIDAAVDDESNRVLNAREDGGQRGVHVDAVDARLHRALLRCWALRPLSWHSAGGSVISLEEALGAIDAPGSARPRSASSTGAAFQSAVADVRELALSRSVLLVDAGAGINTPCALWDVRGLRSASTRQLALCCALLSARAALPPLRALEDAADRVPSVFVHCGSADAAASAALFLRAVAGAPAVSAWRLPDATSATAAAARVAFAQLKRSLSIDARPLRLHSVVALHRNDLCEWLARDDGGFDVQQWMHLLLQAAQRSAHEAPLARSIHALPR